MISFLFLDTERVWRGGQHQLFTLLKGLVQRKHEVHLICHPGTLLEERARAIGVAVRPIRVSSELGLVSFWRFLFLMRRLRPDIVAFNTPRSILPGSIASRFAGIRRRMVFRRVSFPLGRNPITRLKYNWGIDCIVAISESIRRQLEFAGVPASRIRLVYEGLDLANYPRIPQCAKPSFREPLVVGTVASLSREKGHHYLVEAASKIPGVQARMRFVLVGDGECREKLKAQVRLRGLDGCFQFAGFQDQTLEYFKSFDLFVMPSLSEGLSSAILSAMASYLPVVATDVGGIPELVRHGSSGLLVPAADAAALAQAIIRLAENPEEAMRMGLRGRERVEQEFTLERKILQTEELCYSFLHRSAHVSRTAPA
jgi:glycosyltransferase involved in cell wall biosynthesis